MSTSGCMKCWGYNRYGQLGDGSGRNRTATAYVQVMSGFTGAKAIVAGSRHSMVLQQDGSVWATGSNRLGQLGTGSTESEKIFVQIRNGAV